MLEKNTIAIAVDSRRRITCRALLGPNPDKYFYYYCFLYKKKNVTIEQQVIRARMHRDDMMAGANRFFELLSFFAGHGAPIIILCYRNNEPVRYHRIVSLLRGEP